MYHILLICLLMFFPTYPASDTNVPTPKKQRIIKDYLDNGFFSAFIQILHELAWCKHDETPYVLWDSRSLYYNPQGFNEKHNVWEYYFEPASEVPSTTHDNTDLYADRYINFDFSQTARDFAHKIIKKHVKIRPTVQDKIDHFYQQQMAHKKTIGIHLRGTDKKIEMAPTPTQIIVAEALKHADENTQFLVASDEQQLVDLASKLLAPHRVISYDCYRSKNNHPLHLTAATAKQEEKPAASQLGEDILVEVLLLSQCDIFIHTSSNVAAGVLYFNPDLKHVLLGYNILYFFPKCRYEG